jgi:hypothetical protein
MPTQRQLSRQPRQTRKTTTAVRGRAVQKKVGRTKSQRSTRPPNRDRPMRRTQKGRQSSDRAGSGQGARKN